MVKSVLNGKKILIVDDEPELRDAIAFEFKRRGGIIFQAGNGNEAIELVKTHTIQIVVSDIRMPNGDGINLLKKIREIDPNIPIVVLSTGFADINEQDAIKMGAAALLDKPIDRKKMLSIIEGLAVHLEKTL